MNPQHILTLMFFAFSVTSAQAADDAKTQLVTAQSLKCHFGPGSEAQWKDNKAVIGSAPHDEDIQIDSIDLGKQSARVIVIGYKNADDVRVLNTAIGLSFIGTEPTTRFTPAVLDVTTVFAVYTGNHEFPAVESRHANIHGTAALAEQFYGTCQVWQ